MMQEKELVGSLVLMPRFNAWASDGRSRGHIHHRDPSRTLWAESAAYMSEAWWLRPDDAVPCVEDLDNALEIQLHATLGMDITSGAEEEFYT
jgi:hypothetical protein